jgi:hypothetical protein
VTSEQALAILERAEARQPTLLGLLTRRMLRAEAMENRLHRERNILRQALTKLRMGVEPEIIKVELIAHGFRWLKSTRERSN